MRDYARIFNTPVSYLEQKRLIDFLAEVGEAVEDLKEQEHRMRKMPVPFHSVKYKPKHRRR